MGVLGLTTILQQRPIVKVGEAMKYQEEWLITSKSGLSSLCYRLLQTGTSSDELVRLVDRVEVNWKTVLTLLTISTELLPQSDTYPHTYLAWSGLAWRKVTRKHSQGVSSAGQAICYLCHTKLPFL